MSLTLVEWSVDDRRRDDRLNDPRLVDVGWTDALFPSFFEQLTGSTVHLKLKSLVKMINAGSKVTCAPLNAPRTRLDLGFIESLLFPSHRGRSSGALPALAKPVEPRRKQERDPVDSARPRRSNGSRSSFACRHRSWLVVLWALEATPTRSREGM